MWVSSVPKDDCNSIRNRVPTKVPSAKFAYRLVIIGYSQSKRSIHDKLFHLQILCRVCRFKDNSGTNEKHSQWYFLCSTSLSQTCCMWQGAHCILQFWCLWYGKRKFGNCGIESCFSHLSQQQRYSIEMQPTLVQDLTALGRASCTMLFVYYLEKHQWQQNG